MADSLVKRGASMSFSVVFDRRHSEMEAAAAMHRAFGPPLPFSEGRISWHAKEEYIWVYATNSRRILSVAFRMKLQDDARGFTGEFVMRPLPECIQLAHRAGIAALGLLAIAMLVALPFTYAQRSFGAGFEASLVCLLLLTLATRTFWRRAPIEQLRQELRDEILHKLARLGPVTVRT